MRCDSFKWVSDKCRDGGNLHASSLVSTYPYVQTGLCKQKVPLFEIFPLLSAAWQTGQPTHNQSANFRKIELD